MFLESYFINGQNLGIERMMDSRSRKKKSAFWSPHWINEHRSWWKLCYSNKSFMEKNINKQTIYSKPLLELFFFLSLSKIIFEKSLFFVWDNDEKVRRIFVCSRPRLFFTKKVIGAPHIAIYEASKIIFLYIFQVDFSEKTVRKVLFLKIKTKLKSFFDNKSTLYQYHKKF